MRPKRDATGTLIVAPLALIVALVIGGSALANTGTFTSDNNQSGGQQGGDDPPPCDPDTGAGCSCGDNQTPGTHPISAVSGREMLTRTDLVVNGVYPIELQRRYDSQSEYDSALGYGWGWAFDLQLFEYPDGSVVVRNSCGYKYRFLATGGGFSVEDSRQEELTATGSGTYEMRYPHGRRARFDADGRLSELLDPSGNKLVFTYAAGGFKPLWGTSPFSIAPTVPTEVARLPQLTRVQEVLANSTVTGREVTFTYSATTGRLSTTSDDNGRTVTYVHDVVSPSLTKGNLVQVQGLEGIEDAYGYTDPLDAHNMTSSQLGQGTTAWVNTYDAEDRVSQQTRGDRVITFDYSTPFVTVATRTIKSAAGVTIGTAVYRFEYNTDDRLTKRIDPVGNEVHFIRDANGFLDLVRTYQKQGSNLVLQRTEDYGYGLDKNRASKVVTLDSGETVTEAWTYDDHWVASHQLVSSAAPSKLFREEYTFERDAQNRPIRIASVKRRRDDGSFETTGFAYDANGQATVITPPPVAPADGLTVVRSYFTSGATVGMLQKVEVQIGGSADPHLKRTLTYDARDQIDTVTNARSFATDYDFDDLGRIERVGNALGESTSFRYAGPSAVGSFGSAPPGAFLSEVEIGATLADGEGQLRRMRYDTEGRLARVERKDDAGTWSTFLTYAYDSDDNRRQVTDATGRDFFLSYDGLGQLTGIADEASPPNSTGFAYDAVGNRTVFLDAKGRYTYFTYDDLDRLVEIDQDAEALVTSFAYDAAGNVTRVTDPKSQQTDYAYDALSRLLSVEQPLGQSVTYAYDGRGRLTNTMNARGHILRNAYEPWGGLEAMREFVDASATTPTKTVSYTYDHEGSLATVSDDTVPGGSLLYTFAHDALDRVDTTTSHYMPGGDRVLDSNYDRFGNRNSLELDDGSESLVQTWTFDDLDRLVSAGLAGGTTTYGYRPNDELQTITHASGVQTTYTHFPHGPIDTITTRDASSTLLHLLDYTVDATLNIDTVSETRGTGSTQLYDYAYDGVDRLTQALNPVAYGLPGSEDYAYDAAGNRETAGSPSAYDYDANNRITASPGVTYAFDADGNLETENAGLLSEQRFTFDNMNRLVYWEAGPPSSPTATASYAYDPFGRRLKKTVSGVTTWFLWDGDVLAAEFNGSGNRTRRYTYDGGWAPAELVTNSAGTEIAYAVTTDHLDTPRMLVNSAGVPVWRSSHNSFGLAVAIEDPDGDSTLVSSHVRFPGQYADSETGLHYNRFRDYDPSVGRYTSADPIGQLGALAYTGVALSRVGASSLSVLGLGSENLYVYALANPTTFVDATGEWVWIAAGGVVGATVNAGATYLANSGNVTGSQLAAAAASGFIAGALGAAAGPLGGSYAASLGYASNGLAAATATGLLSAAASAFAQVVANSIDPCHPSSPLNAALWGGLGGGAAKGLVPTNNLNSWAQASYFGASTVGGLFGSTNAWRNLGSAAASSGVAGAANFRWSNPFK